MARSIVLLISIFLYLALFTAASPAQFPRAEIRIFSRQQSDEICGTGSERCTNPLVSNFCCPTGTECIAVLDNTAVGCCPKGQDCRIISPSSCDSIQSSLGSSAPVSQCSSGKAKGQCCPPGYLCDGSFCQLQFESWPTSQGGPSPTQIPVAGTPISSDGGNATALSEAQREAGFIYKDECAVVTLGGFASGFLPGLVLGAALSYLVVCARRKRKENIAKHFSRMPSTNTRSVRRKGSKGSKRDQPSISEKSVSKHDLTIGYNPEVTVTAPQETYDGLGVSNVIAGHNYAVSNTSTQMFAQYDEPSDPARRGRLRVHGETPPLPSVALADATHASAQHQRSDSLPQHVYEEPPNPSPEHSSKKHKRKNSNPSFKDLTNTSRFKFRNLLSHENLRESRGSVASDTSVGSSIHSSIFTGSERQSRGLRYPIALQPGSGRAKGSNQNTPTSLRHEVSHINTIQRADTNASDKTNIDDDITPTSPSDPKGVGSHGVSNYPPRINVPPHSYSLREQLTSPELHERYLNIPKPTTVDRTSVASTAMTEMTEVDGYKSPFHDRHRYRSYASEASYSDGYESDDGRSVAANSMYPSSFLDIHFDATSPVSPIDHNSRSIYSNKGLREVPSIPSIPPLFLKNQQLSQPGVSKPRQDLSPGVSPIDRESCDITVVIDDGLGPASPRYRGNFSTASKGPIGIGGAMTGGRYTMQTMQTNRI